MSFPTTEEEIRRMRAGDSVLVDGHVIGLRDRTQIRIFDQGMEPPMDLTGAFLLHTAPGVRKLAPGRYEKVCIGTTTSARMVRFTEGLGMVYFAIVGGAAALETTQIEEIEEVAWEELMPECLWKFRVKDFGPLTVGIDAHGNSLYHDVQSAAQKKLDELKRWLQQLGLTHVEISDGTLEIPRDRKLELIEDFARDFTVLSEVGSKDADVVFAPYEWVEWIKEEKEAGAWKVITEAREGGTAGIFRPSGEMRTGLVDEIAHSIDVDDLVWEAPTKASQAWFIKQFGPTVKLGNIPPDEVIPLETLRLGLRGDTLKEVLPRGNRTPTA